MSLVRTKSIDALIADAGEPGHRLSKTLGPWSLTALGIGAVIGSGIFILTGTAAAGETLAVPSIMNAPVLDILRHWGNPISTIGRPGVQCARPITQRRGVTSARRRGVGRVSNQHISKLESSQI